MKNLEIYSVYFEITVLSDGICKNPPQGSSYLFKNSANDSKEHCLFFTDLFYTSDDGPGICWGGGFRNLAFAGGR